METSRYYTVQEWMVKGLKLSGGELSVYAIIFGFSQDGLSRFTGSAQYLSDWTNISKRRIFTILSALVDKGLIRREAITMNDNLKSYAYSAVLSISQKAAEGGEESSRGVKKVHGGSEESSPNNIAYKESITNNTVEDLSIINSSNEVKDNTEIYLENSIRESEEEVRRSERHEKDLFGEEIIEEKSEAEKLREFSEEFKTLWKAFPRKEGKQLALKAYLKARLSGVPMGTVKEGIDRYRKSVEEKGTEKQFIKMASTWFNQHCWDDDYEGGQNGSGKKQRFVAPDYNGQFQDEAENIEVIRI